ncbi:hypothetical protein HBH92_181440 [Parastagonospora nodorum]|nr:hypothetical protein HBI10_173400 [Parastagonospora nodorum]KAH4016104.1 hypothetical protein HBI13_153350 [Parastagonospora nodorum]KAH4180065.1 hypothetical protein HBH42_242580 [Parastagonospora nodorum]KAH4202865.1 hypothetical protein HBI95_159030 [Parastagonospora nodorum]KAH4405274.1 hypothetical protein HBH92_181440 [Parastagonospora nodorum]
MSIRYNPKLFTIENLLRTDKRSQLIEISEQGGWSLLMADLSITSAATSSRDITVALGRNAFDSTRPGAIDATRVINPLELEIRLNPVHFAPSQAEPPMHYDVENSPRSSITFMSNQKEEHAKNPRSPYQADQDSLAIPDLSPSIGKGSEDIDMIEPVTPLTSSFTLDSNTTSKICRTSLTSSPLSVDEADDAGEGLSCELYGSKSDLHGTAPFSHDLQILQAHCESAMIEDVVQKMSIPVSAPSSTQLASPCAESILPSSAFLDSTQSESHSSPSVDEAVTNQDTLRKRLLDHSSSNDTTTFTCAHCHLPFPTKGKVK